MLKLVFRIGICGLLYVMGARFEIDNGESENVCQNT